MTPRDTLERLANEARIQAASLRHFQKPNAIVSTASPLGGVFIPSASWFDAVADALEAAAAEGKEP